jgi:hypothetical protein
MQIAVWSIDASSANYSTVITSAIHHAAQNCRKVPKNIGFNKEHRPENDRHGNAADVKSTEEYLQRNPNDEQSRAREITRKIPIYERSHPVRGSPLARWKSKSSNCR